MAKDDEDRLDKLRKIVEKGDIPNTEISTLIKKFIDVEKEEGKRGWIDRILGERNQRLKIVSIFGVICLLITLVVLYQNDWKISEAVAVFSSMTTTCIGYIAGAKNGDMQSS